MKPGDAVLLNNLGYLYTACGKYDEAVKYFEKTLAVDPARKEAHGNLADAYMKLGRPQDAKAHYQQYLALWPTSPKAEEVKKILQGLN